MGSSLKDELEKAGMASKNTNGNVPPQRNDKKLPNYDNKNYNKNEDVGFDIFEDGFDYVNKADEVIDKIKSNLGYNAFSDLTTSKIRNILSIISNISNKITIESNSMEEKEKFSKNDIYNLKVRLIYEYGRDKTKAKVVQKFIKEAQLVNTIDNIGESKERFIRFSKYMEALVAYHRYHGGKD